MGKYCDVGNTHTDMLSNVHMYIVELQFEHWWLVYHGYFKLVLESLTKIIPKLQALLYLG